ncbi:RTC4-like domain-containing protein [Achaetomium macrosporum]|uniref:Restriction of telomere capping protein 4 n=1 Tax=Achaetomium macrosporum TaxID=79813 RepID=A0AAN7C439_9PEZI|nr:RTC4-like domain-containing protein [Achaetomium macrosporum]
MFDKRHVGLSSKQSVPRLLKVIRPPVTKDMKDVDVDAPPLSSSDLDDSDGLSNRGNIRPSRFLNASQPSSSSIRKSKDDEADGKARTSAARFKRTRVSTRLGTGREPGSSPKDADRQSEVTEADKASSPPASKKFKRTCPGAEELGDESRVDSIFSQQKRTVLKRYSTVRTFGKKARQEASPKRTLKQPPKASTPEDGSPKRIKKLRMPSSPSKLWDEPVSPPRKLKSIPDSDSDSTMDGSPVRKKRLKMPDDESLAFSAIPETPEESQRPVFRIPDELPDSFIEARDEKLDFAVTPTADTSSAYNLMRRSTSPLTDLGSLDSEFASICPLCRKEVSKAQLDDFKERHPRVTVANMQKFCQEHQRRSARETWIQKGYPDIDWRHLDDRIAQHYSFLRKILEGGEPSHYDKLFRETIRSGQNRTLLTSDANLTPGYYGIRGLRAMSENLIRELSSLLRKRALQDRLVSARGHTAYLQSVLVPELAVRLIMEDMSVGEEEARKILTDSSAVGELVNDEIADRVVLEEDDVSD